MRRTLLLLVLAASAAGAQSPSPSPSPGPAANPGAFATSLTLFAGTSSGLWRSTDWGGTWAQVKSPSSGDKVEEVGAVREVVTLAPLVFVGGDKGIYYSRDFGVAWERLKFEGEVRCLMTTHWPQADPTLLVGTAAGLQISPNGGYTFKPGGLPEGVQRIQWPGPELVVATGKGVAISRDTAASWLPVGTGLPEDEVRALAVSSLYALDPVLFAGTAANGLWRSKDGGKSWSAIDALPATEINDLAWIGPQLYASTASGLFLSEDTGRTWSKAATGLEGRVPGRLMFPSAPESTVEGFLATDDGVYRTADGGRSWKPTGLQGQQVLTVATFPPQTSPGDLKKKGKRR